MTCLYVTHIDKTDNKERFAGVFESCSALSSLDASVVGVVVGVVAAEASRGQR